jgi:outer membrane murein-binding lipoprotein Lpp
MFTIFEEENEPLSERAKVDELLTKVQHTALAAAVAQLRFQLNTEGVTFTVAANHLNSAVSQTQDYQVARKISSTNTNERQQPSARPLPPLRKYPLPSPFPPCLPQPLGPIWAARPWDGRGFLVKSLIHHTP